METIGALQFIRVVPSVQEVQPLWESERDGQRIENLVHQLGGCPCPLPPPPPIILIGHKSPCIYENVALVFTAFIFPLTEISAH